LGTTVFTWERAADETQRRSGASRRPAKSLRAAVAYPGAREERAPRTGIGGEGHHFRGLLDRQVYWYREVFAHLKARSRVLSLVDLRIQGEIVKSRLPFCARITEYLLERGVSSSISPALARTRRARWDWSRIGSPCLSLQERVSAGTRSWQPWERAAWARCSAPTTHSSIAT